MSNRTLPDKYYGENGIHRVPMWRIGGYALNNTATNLYMFMMMYVSYYLIGFVGVATILASSFSTIMRIWDGVTDPFVGMLVDKTDGRFGKNRPFIVLGNLILLVTSYILFHVTHLLPEGGIRFVFFIIISAIYYIGYTFQCVVTKSAQTCITNDPKQRPIFSVFDAVYNTFLFAGMNIYVSGLSAKYGTMYSTELFHELWMFTAITSAVFTIIAVISIAPKDRTEFYGTGGNQQKVGLKDYIDTLKHNRALQMLIVSASSDKLATSMKTSTVTIVLYGIVAGNYAVVNSSISMITSIAGSVLAVVAISTLATKFGQKEAMLIGSWGGIVVNVLLIFLWIFGDASTMLTADKTAFNWGFFAIAHVLLMILLSGFQGVSGNIVIPMTADCADYEVYRTGKYVPGLMGTLFSFVDKLISSLAPLITGVLFAMVGYADALPDVTSPYSTGIHYVGVFCMFGMVIVGLVCNVVALKFYPLSKEKMAEIQGEIAEIKAKAMAGNN